MVKLGIALILTSCQLMAKPLSLPLNYDPGSGLYTVKFYIDAPPQTMDMVVDTGSANVNVVGNSLTCQDCLINTTKGRYSSHAPPISYSLIPMAYGSSHGKVMLHNLMVGFDYDNRVPYNIGVYATGKHLNNILGLAYTPAVMPSGIESKTFFDTLIEANSYSDQFTLQLCDNRSASALILNGKADNTGLQTPVIEQWVYTIALRSISTEDKKFSLKFGDKLADQAAMVDSGATGAIAMPPEQTKPLVNYIRSFDKNNVPDEFWHNNNLCVEDKHIDLSAYPTLQFEFPDLSGKSFYLSLSPQRYFSSDGCGKGFVRLAFTGKNLQSESVKQGPKYAPKFIIGTPLLEAYNTIFVRTGEPSRLIFKPAVCQ